MIPALPRRATRIELHILGSAAEAALHLRASLQMHGQADLDNLRRWNLIIIFCRTGVAAEETVEVFLPLGYLRVSSCDDHFTIEEIRR
jgi:hypothetical protein